MSDRKYRQRGYQDSGGGESRERRPPAPRPADRRPGPRGRGLGRPTASVFRCAVCGHQQAVALAVDSVCAQCGKDLHTCTHCQWFDASAPGECRQTGLPYVSSKAKRNQCEGFEPRVTQEFAKEPETPSSAKSAFDALFKF